MAQGDVLLDVPCTCDEKPYPHFKHYDGSGPGSKMPLWKAQPHYSQAERKRLGKGVDDWTASDRGWWWER